jgi:alcohol dehydrogenase class IV
MPLSFQFEEPKGIYFGPGSRSKLPEFLAPFGERVLVLTGHSWLKSSGRQVEFEKLLSRFSVEIYPCPEGEPTLKGINAARKDCGKLHPDMILAIGGGSVLDTAKALSALIPLSEGPEDYLEGIGIGKTLETPGLPWFAMPTTAGTGAEVTKNAVIRVAARGVKKSFRSPHLLATYAIVDPELTLSLPLRQTGIAGMDALSQLLEAFVSKKNKPVPRALIKDAFPGMLKALRTMVHNPKDMESRTNASYGSLISGIALSNSGLGAAHGFASVLGGLYEIPHGLLCAVFLGPVIRFNAPVIEEDIAALLATAGLYRGKDPLRWLIAEIEELLDLYQLEINFKCFGIVKSKVKEIAGRAAGSSMLGNPISLSQSDKVKLLEEIL